MQILIASPEALPFVKTGGLADVAGALLNEYARMGEDAALILPLYRKIKKNAGKFNIKPAGRKITVPVGGNIEEGILWEGKTAEGGRAYFIENDKFYGRDDLYGTPEGDFPDNAGRFTFYCRGVLEAVKALELNINVIHCNDWQTGLIPVYTKTICKNEFPEIATLMTIHNLGYQGLFPSHDLPLTGFGWEMFNMEALEFYGRINFLKGGIVFADAVSTVSGNYAREILTREYGFGLEGVLAKKSKNLCGIINGIDYNEWDPENDSLIPVNYSRGKLSGKAACKKSLQKTCGLPQKDVHLIGMVTRLSAQKGLDLVADAMEGITGLGAQMIILGKGDESFHKIFLDLKKKYKEKLSVTIGFDDRLAHNIYAGSDFFLMPSKYEPCGLGQLIAQRYGAIPIGRATGGIADTVIPYNPADGSGTGFLFEEYSPEKLLETVRTACSLFSDKRHRLKLRKNAMSQDFSWRKSAKDYLSLYKKILRGRN
ncbi:MAG: glycogen synthase GlgA [Nitrospirae bacterium]|nr:glycogen synthase GlgA [Nitrospirota bacterium]